MNKWIDVFFFFFLVVVCFFFLSRTRCQYSFILVNFTRHVIISCVRVWCFFFRFVPTLVRFLICRFILGVEPRRPEGYCCGRKVRVRALKVLYVSG